MTLEQEIAQVGQQARTSSRSLARASVGQLDFALEQVAAGLQRRGPEIKAANQLDLVQAEAAGLTGAMLERLKITDQTLLDMAAGARQVQSLPNPLNEILKDWEQPNGLHLRKIRVPIGVIGIIYESRPNVTIDAAILCLKTGNAVILRGGSEAFHSNQILGQVLREGLLAAGLPLDSVQVIATTDRAAIPLLCSQAETIDLLIPRGGRGLIETVVAHARMPVIKHFHGVCHVYVDAEADLTMAEEIIINAKCQRPSVCNALETILIDQEIASRFVPQIAQALWKNQVEIRGDETVRELAGEKVVPARQEDWTTEYLDLIVSVRVVPNFAAAIAHLDAYGSKHSDAIVTANAETAQRFFQEVDSATVYWNASTRFTDGAQFGFGAEIGISTDKIHARGPMGLPELTSYKYLIEGTGQIRA